MSRWSNRFVSLSWLILLAACHSTPPEDSQAPALYIVKRGADGTVNADAAAVRFPERRHAKKLPKSVGHELAQTQIASNAN